MLHSIKHSLVYKLILTTGFCLAMVLPLDNKAQVAVSIGSKIRALRQRLKRTLDEVATTAGISKPFLSQVERGLATPSITSLVGIARALGVTVQYFVDTPTEDKSVRRGSELNYFGFDGTANRFGRLTNLSVGGQLEAILVRMPVGQNPSEVTTHAGEEFLYVMSGQISLTLEGTTFLLQAGDTAHYESTVPHAWCNTAREEAVIVWVGTPRLF
ncbi:MAG: family transcriptional regulator [Caballeronia sp.]|jgi:transcriptional regulator with XRE-family HTH domain|nr:family transcriptional regulator [Caballeronia sp.]